MPSKRRRSKRPDTIRATIAQIAIRAGTCSRAKDGLFKDALELMVGHARDVPVTDKDAVLRRRLIEHRWMLLLLLLGLAVRIRAASAS